MASLFKKVGVVGAGAMGAQIAEIMALNGFDVVTRHRTEESKERALNDVDKALQSLLRFNSNRAEKEIRKMEQTYGLTLDEEQKSKVKEKLKSEFTEEMMTDAKSKIQPTLKLEDFNDVDLVIESVVEDINIKREIFNKIDKIAPENAIFASNTSTLLISEIAAATQRFDKFIGIHFFNPPVILPLIEIIPGIGTSKNTVESVFNFSKTLKNHRGLMKPIMVKEVPGFLVNRVLLAMLNEAFSLYEEEVASVNDIDIAMKSGAGMPMGPFELADLIGIDVLYHMNQSIKEMQGGNVTPKPIQLLRKMKAIGQLGRKTRKGFYEY